MTEERQPPAELLPEAGDGDLPHRMAEAVVQLKQPTRIPYINAKRGCRSYVPDFLVTFRDGSQTLDETKYRAELKAKSAHLRPRRGPMREGTEHGEGHV